MIRCGEMKNKKPKGILMRLFLLVTIFMFLTAVSPGRAEAHRVNVFAYVEGNTCHVEGYFSRSRPAQNATVEVFDPSGKKLLEGKTDAEGNFAFPVTEKNGLRIVLTASLGHKGVFVLTAADTGGALETSPPSGKEPPMVPSAKPSGANLPPVDVGTLQRMIDASLEKRLRPLYAEVSKIAEEKSEVSAREVFAGFGYIVGIFGIAFYIAARRRER
jgi:nickel transport protein